MKLKFGMVGPSGAGWYVTCDDSLAVVGGKTLIANILGNEMSMDNSIGRPPYRPTSSVRIVEFSIPSVDIRKYTAEVDCQLWEIGGNPRLKSIWPGVQSNLDGIILVYDTNNELHVRDMSALHMHFVTHSNLNPSQCLVIGNQFRGNREGSLAKIVGVGPRVRHFVVNVDDDPNYLRDEFKHFLTGVAQFILDQEKNPTSSFISSKDRREGTGDASTAIIKPSKPLEEVSRAINQAVYYQPYTEFHNARNNNKTRNRRENMLENDKTEEIAIDPKEFLNRPPDNTIPGIKNNIPKDEFSIHRKTRRN